MSFKSTLQAASRLVRPGLFGEFRSLASDSNLTLGQMAAWRVRAMQTIHSLQEVEFSVSSQWGQDGIIDWLIERAAIPPALQSFIEFGVQDYRVSNTRFLLQNRNWRGLIMDGSPDTLPTVKADRLYWKHDLTVKQAFITRENINDLITSANFSGEIGLLSVDIDGNDYWVWEAISAVNPILCICEYNAIFGDLHPLSVPYDPGFVRTSAHFSNLYFGTLNRRLAITRLTQRLSLRWHQPCRKRRLLRPRRLCPAFHRPLPPHDPGSPLQVPRITRP